VLAAGLLGTLPSGIELAGAVVIVTGSVLTLRGRSG